ncbi:phage major capsid protein, P2 family [Serratia bockelmannii]|uniref:phage major capsid protein, P2 family n=1 Tax=Serratia bockelmannii TaxID=2703793 RepID=UPI003FA7CBDD
MRTETRVLFDAYLEQQASINGQNLSTLQRGLSFSVEPSVEQRLEDRVQDSSELLKKVNLIGVNEMEGDKILLGVRGPLASTNSSNTDRREPRSADTLDDDKYRCEQTNTDTFIAYSKIDAWAKFPDFQARLSNEIVKRIALDRIMVGFNGTSHAKKSDLAKNPLLQDVNIGWLEKYRLHAKKRVLTGMTITSRDADNKIIQKGKYGNIDSLAHDARTTLLDAWYIDDPNLVVIIGRTLMNSREFPIINAISQTNPNSEALAGQLIMTQKLIGGMPTFIAPFMPAGTMFITSFENLSIYWQLGGHRRMIREEPEYNRIATYSSSNDAYVIEDYGFGCLVEGITWAGEHHSA